MTRLLLASATALWLALSSAGCAVVGAPMNGGDDDPNNPNNPNDPNDPGGDPAACLGDGNSGASCVVTADCIAPNVCLDGTCVGPTDPDNVCDEIEGIECASATDACVGGVCVANPGSCDTVDQCPLGYLCESGSCVPERDGEACADPSSGPSLAGTWKVDSALHMREALPGVIDGILNVAEDARDIIEGDIDLGLPSLVEAVIGGVVSSIIQSYVPQWALSLITGLGDVSDMIDDMRVEATMEFDGQPCDGNYRVRQKWDWITFDFRGQEMRVQPSRLPGVEELEPEDFGAWYSCGEIYFDKHRIDQSLSGLVRFLVDTVTQAVTGYQTVEEALDNMVDCYSFAVALDNYVFSVCSYCPVVTNIAYNACENYKDDAIADLTEKIDEAAVDMSLVKLKGIGTVIDGDTVQNGTWYGSFAGGDFPGEFVMTRQ